MPTIGIAHLTLLALSPPELVSTAAEAGYDFVGVRVKAVTEGEHQYPMAPGSPMSRETLLRPRDTGLTVRDVEFLQIRPHTGPDDWMPALEAGAALGASTFSVVGVDPDRAGSPPPSPASPPTPPRTASARRWSPSATSRSAGSPTPPRSPAPPVPRCCSTPCTSSAAAPASTTSARWSRRSCRCLQICDGPLATPASLELPAQLPLGMTADGSVLQVEAARRAPGPRRGRVPAGELLAAVPPGTPISVEVPNATLTARLSPVEFAARNRRGVEALHVA